MNMAWKTVLESSAFFVNVSLFRYIHFGKRGWAIYGKPKAQIRAWKSSTSNNMSVLRYNTISLSLIFTKTTKMSYPFSLQVDIFETGSCLSRGVLLTFLCIFWNYKSGHVDFGIFCNPIRYFLQLLLFTDSQILPCRTDFCAVYFPVNDWNRSFT